LHAGRLDRDFAGVMFVRAPALEGAPPVQPGAAAAALEKIRAHVAGTGAALRAEFEALAAGEPPLISQQVPYSAPRPSLS